MTLDELANEMRNNQNNPTSNLEKHLVWNPEIGGFEPVLLQKEEKLSIPIKECIDVW